jgi:hypothetical protein
MSYKLIKIAIFLFYICKLGCNALIEIAGLKIEL